MPGLFSEFSPKVQTEAEKVVWTGIKGGDMDTAWKMALAYQRCEDATLEIFPAGTKANVGILLLYYTSQGVDVPLKNIPAQEINPRTKKYAPRPTYGRDKLLKKIIKRKEDLAKVPPVVITPTEYPSVYRTLDGQNRTEIAKDLGADIRAFVLPKPLLEVYKDYAPASDQFSAELNSRLGK